MPMITPAIGVSPVRTVVPRPVASSTMRASFANGSRTAIRSLDAAMVNGVGRPSVFQMDVSRTTRPPRPEGALPPWARSARAFSSSTGYATPAGAVWKERLAGSDLLERLRMIWDSASLTAFVEHPRDGWNLG